MNYKVKKIAENNVEVMHSKEMTDINGKVFQVFDGEIESFGEKGLTKALEDIENQILYWQNFDEKAYKKKMQDKVQERKQILLDVQTEMNK